MRLTQLCRAATGISVLFTLLALSQGCDGCGTRPPRHITFESEVPTPDFRDDAVKFCWKKGLKPPVEGRAQVLFDASGSMIGSTKVVPHVARWIRQAISQLQDSTLRLEVPGNGLRLCQFSTFHKGIKCDLSFGNLSAYRVKGDTNLHEAIRSSKDYELTFIVTDGVAATSPDSSGDCATGVDAKCVARSLKEAIHGTSGRGSSSDNGLWVMPFLSTYDGKFYTEAIPPSDFQAQDQTARDNVQKDHPQADVQIQNPNVGYQNLLEFTSYRGPRAMVIIVVARWTHVGRAAVQALWERADYQGVDQLASLADFAAGVATLPPFEVYPGLVDTIEWKTLVQPQTRAEVTGTIDVKHDPGTEPFRVSVGCPEGRSGEGLYALEGVTSTAGESSGCAPIHLLPAVTYELQAERPGDKDDLPGLFKGWRRVDGEFDRIQMKLVCGSGTSRDCDTNPIPMQWTASMQFAKAANCLNDSACNYAAHRFIRELSTARLNENPHRIYGLDDTLEAFYREVANDDKGDTLASLDLCTR